MVKGGGASALLPFFMQAQAKTMKKSKKGSADPFSSNFNWFLFLDQKFSDISPAELHRASTLAASWVTCACGQLCRVLPRDCNNAPEDKTIRNLGLEFMNQISFASESSSRYPKKHFGKAKEILVKIEKRTSVLLKYEA
jgi:hypothetical protein